MEGERSATGAKRAADEAGLGTPEAPEARRACQEGDIGAQFRSGAESNLVGQHPAPAHAETSPQGSEQGPSATSFVPLSAVPRGALDRVETPISGAPSETVVPETSGGPADGADGRVEGGARESAIAASGRGEVDHDAGANVGEQPAPHGDNATPDDAQEVEPDGRAASTAAVAQGEDVRPDFMRPGSSPISWDGMNEAERAVLLARLREIAPSLWHDPTTEPERIARLHGTAAERVMVQQYRAWGGGSVPEGQPVREAAVVMLTVTGQNAPPMTSAGGGDGGGILGSDSPQDADTNQQGDPPAEHEGDDTTEEEGEATGGCQRPVATIRPDRAPAGASQPEAEAEEAAAPEAEAAAPEAAEAVAEEGGGGGAGGSGGVGGGGDDARSPDYSRASSKAPSQTPTLPSRPHSPQPDEAACLEWRLKTAEAARLGVKAVAAIKAAKAAAKAEAEAEAEAEAAQVAPEAEAAQAAPEAKEEAAEAEAADDESSVYDHEGAGEIAELDNGEERDECSEPQ